MRKIMQYAMIVSAIMMCSLVSCKNGNTPVEQEIATIDKVQIGNFTPIMIEERDGFARIVFMESARPYRIDMQQNGEYLELIRSALKDAIPVKVSVFGSTTEIAEVTAASKETLRLYQKAKIPPVRISENLPVIPGEAALNALFAAAKSPSIPFAYVVDGCYARAHKMRQIIRNNGYDCVKLFAYGDLWASNGSCCVEWGYHVAPLVRFRNSNGTIEERVIDPSLFPNGPVTRTAWLNACQNKSCSSYASVLSTKITDGAVYYAPGPNGLMREAGYVYDNNYVNTNCVIAAFTGLSGCYTPRPSTNHCGY